MEPAFAQERINRRGDVEYGDDAGLIVQFFMESEYQSHKSEQAGRPIYEDKPYIRIMFPGDKTREVCRRVDMTGRKGIPDPDRFPRQWASFKRQEQHVEEGTPLEEWGPMSRSVARTYKGMNIFTVENLAAVPDSALHSMGHGARDWRDKANAWLKQAGDGAEVTRLAKENQSLKDDLESKDQQISDLAARLDALESGEPIKRRPGRTRKS